MNWKNPSIPLIWDDVVLVPRTQLKHEIIFPLKKYDDFLRSNYTRITTEDSHDFSKSTLSLEEKKDKYQKLYLFYNYFHSHGSAPFLRQLGYEGMQNILIRQQKVIGVDVRKLPQKWNVTKTSERDPISGEYFVILI